MTTPMPEWLEKKRDEYFEAQRKDAYRCCDRCGQRWDNCSGTYRSGFTTCHALMSEREAKLVEALKFVGVEALKLLGKEPTSGHKLEALFDRIHRARQAIEEVGG